MSAILVLVCHPDSRSLTHAAGAVVREALSAAGHEPLVRDLYAERFDPVLTAVELRRKFSFDELVQSHYRDLDRVQGLVLVHPEWWNQPPAVLKGWIDRVLITGVGYEYQGEDHDTKRHVPLLSGKRALALITTDAAPAEGEPIVASMWRQILSFCGITSFRCEMLYRVRDLGYGERRAWLQAIPDVLRDVFPA